MFKFACSKTFLLISHPQKNLEVENWEEDKNNNKDNIDINTIKENLEKLL